MNLPDPITVFSMIGGLPGALMGARAFGVSIALGAWRAVVEFFRRSLWEPRVSE
jgi:hypothetical protein